MAVDCTAEKAGAGNCLQCARGNGTLDAGASTRGMCVAVCGDGRVAARREGCDDGNQVSGDGCSDVCALEEGYSCSARSDGPGGQVCEWVGVCGDGRREGREACDDGNVELPGPQELLGMGKERGEGAADG
ncbi:hypothetical protein T484DRAFT_1791962, partial [Baffinella frigidus]